MNPRGKGVFIWQLQNCAGGDPIALASRAQAAGFTWIAIKAANGMADFNAAYFQAAKAALDAVGIQVWGWQYIYGGNIFTGASIARQEAEAAIRNIQRYNLAGWIPDPESEYKRRGAAAWADTYMTSLRATFPSLPIGLCSYRFPSLHPELPWSNFLRYSNFHAPQVYWMQAHNPDEQLTRSFQELEALAILPFIPLGSAFAEHGWQPTVTELNLFDREAHVLGLPGVSWWCWDDQGLETHPEYMAAITAHDWGQPVPPPPSLPAHVSSNGNIINFRDAPVISPSSDVGDIKITKADVIGEEGDFWKITGYVAKSVTKVV